MEINNPFEWQKEWAVFIDISKWENNAWITVIHRQITPSRQTEEETKKDFEALDLCAEGTYFFEEITPGEIWNRAIIQCRTIF